MIKPGHNLKALIRNALNLMVDTCTSSYCTTTKLISLHSVCIVHVHSYLYDSVSVQLKIYIIIMTNLPTLSSIIAH